MFNQFYSKLPILPDIQNNFEFDNSSSLNRRLETLEQNLKNNEDFNRSLYDDIQNLRLDYLNTMTKVGEDFRKSDEELSKLNKIFLHNKSDIDRLSSSVNNINQGPSALHRSLSAIEIPRPVPELFRKNYENKLNNISKQTNVMAEEVAQFKHLCNNLQDQIFDVSKRIQVNNEEQKNFIKSFNIENKKEDIMGIINTKIGRQDQKMFHMAESMKKLEVISQNVFNINSLVMKEKENRISMEDTFSKRLRYYDQELKESLHLRQRSNEELDYLRTEMKMELRRIETKNDHGLLDLYQKVELQKQLLKSEQTFQGCFEDISKELVSKPMKNGQTRIVSDNPLSNIIERLRKEYLHFSQDARDNAMTQLLKVKNIEKRLSEIKKNDEKHFQLMKEKLAQINFSRISNHKNLKIHLNSLDQKILAFKDFLDEKITSIKNDSVIMSAKLQENMLKVIEVNASKFRKRLVQIEDSIEMERTEILEINKNNMDALLQLVENFRNDFNNDIQPTEESKEEFKIQVENLLKSKMDVALQISNHPTVHTEFLSNLAKEIENNNTKIEQVILDFTEKLRSLEEAVEERQFLNSDFEGVKVVLRKLAESVVIVKEALYNKITKFSQSTSNDISLITHDLERIKETCTELGATAI